MDPAYAPSPVTWLLLLALSWGLVGLIWTIALVHYPAFRYAGAEWEDAHAHHTTWIGVLVGPIMVVELGVAFYVAWRSGYQWQWLVPLGLVVLTWANTFFQAVPLHNQLGLAHDIDVVERLVRVNWVRTVLWTAKAGWVSWLFVGAWRV